MTSGEMVESLARLGYKVTEEGIKTWRLNQRVQVEKWIAYKNRKDITRGRPHGKPRFLERYNRNGSASRH